MPDSCYCLYLVSPRPSSTYLLTTTTFIIERRTTSFIIHLYCLTVNVRVKDIVTSLFLSTFSYRYQQTTEQSSSEIVFEKLITLGSSPTIPSQRTSYIFYERAVARANQPHQTKTIMPTMPVMTRPNNLTRFDNNNNNNTLPHTMSHFYNKFNTGSPALMYFSVMGQFILLTFVGVFLLGFLMCFIRYRLRTFRRVRMIVRIWVRDIVWKIKDLFSGRGGWRWPWARQSSRRTLPPNRRRWAGSV